MDYSRHASSDSSRVVLLRLSLSILHGSFGWLRFFIEMLVVHLAAVTLIILVALPGSER